MDKKEYLKRILVQLEPIRDLAKGLEVLVDEGNLGDDLLDLIIESVQGAINSAKSELDKGKLQKGLDALQKMKQMEEESRLQDEKDLEELDKIIDSF